MEKIGIFDIGGSSIKYSLDELKTFQTEVIENISKELILEFVAKTCNENQIDIICAAAPGVINPAIGSVHSLSTIINWKDFNFYDELRNLLNNKETKIFVDNDGKCSLLGNIKMLDQKVDNAISIVFGTGVGGACYFNGKLYRGSTNCAGEFGMSKTDYYSTSCISEDNSSVTLIKQINNELNTNYTSQEIWDLYKNQDFRVGFYINKWLMKNTLIVFNLLWSLDPDVIFIGGGIAANQTFQESFLKTLDSLYENNNQTRKCKVQFNSDGNYANLLGALSLYK